MRMKNNRETLIFVAGLLIGLLGGYLFFTPNTVDAPDSGTQDRTEAIEEDGSTKAGTAGGQEDAISLTVSDQSSGTSVAIKSVTLNEQAWVAVMEGRGDGKPGNILGAQLFDKGTASGTVELLRRTTPARTYFVAIYTSDGDRTFEFKGDDTPLLSADGELILVEFQTYPTSPR